MSPPAEDIRQHDTHTALVGQTGPQDVPLAKLDLDAIIVPAARPALNLDHAVTLARAAECSLLILCSRQVRPAEVEQMLAERSFKRAVIIDLPDGYRHELLDFPALTSLKSELPEACASYVTDLSTKRNVGLLLARMLRWQRIFFLDDDIRDITYPDLQHTVSMLETYPTVGIRIIKYPDNSIVCHANRETDGFQDVFVSGAALAVNCHADIGFFPDIYNEDWLFFFDDASGGQLASSGVKATQLVYDPFANPQRAAWQEFGDVLAEGLYGLLHLGKGLPDATRDYWADFLEVRRRFLEEIITRSDKARPDIQNDLVLSVESALKCSVTIAPELCERYIQLWRQDLLGWKQRMARIPKMPSLEAALGELGLSPWVEGNVTARIQRRPDEIPENIAAGPVVIPKFATLKQLSERAGAHALGSAPATNAGIADTQPIPVVKGHEGFGRLWKQRPIEMLSSIRYYKPLRRASARWSSGTLARDGGAAEPEAETTAV